MQTCNIAVISSGNLEDKELFGQPKKFEDIELEALLEENSSQVLEELSTSLEVDLSTVENRRKLDPTPIKTVDKRRLTCNVTS